MIKYLFLFLLLITQAQASYKDIEPISIDHLSEEAGISLLKKHLKDSPYIWRTHTFSFDKKSTPYTNGDFVILWGVGSDSNDQAITEKEYKRMWSMMNYLSNKNFRVVINVKALKEDLVEALSSKTTSVIVYSSHGNDRKFYDFNSAPIPTDIFKHRSSNVYQFVLSACYGSYALQNYRIPQDLYVYSWPGLTNPDELIRFLVSDEYSALTGKKK